MANLDLEGFVISRSSALGWLAETGVGCPPIWERSGRDRPVQLLQEVASNRSSPCAGQRWLQLPRERLSSLTRKRRMAVLDERAVAISASKRLSSLEPEVVGTFKGHAFVARSADSLCHLHLQRCLVKVRAVKPPGGHIGRTCCRRRRSKPAGSPTTGAAFRLAASEALLASGANTFVAGSEALEFALPSSVLAPADQSLVYQGIYPFVEASPGAAAGPQFR